MPASQEKQMDNSQLVKMSDALSKDLRAMKEQLDNERREKELLIKAQQERDVELEELRKHMSSIKDEKKKHFSAMIESDVKPFLNTLRESGKEDERFTQCVDKFESNMNAGLEDAFMNEDQMAQLQVLRAAASANQVTSSKLEELFKSQKEWESKFSALQNEKDDIIKSRSEMEEELKKANIEKEKLVEDLKRELEELRSTHNKTKENIKNVDSHFHGNSPVTENTEAPATTSAQETSNMETQQTVTATASNTKYYNGFETLFDFAPRTNWR